MPALFQTALQRGVPRRAIATNSSGLVPVAWRPGSSMRAGLLGFRTGDAAHKLEALGHAGIAAHMRQLGPGLVWRGCGLCSGVGVSSL